MAIWAISEELFGETAVPDLLPKCLYEVLTCFHLLCPLLVLLSSDLLSFSAEFPGAQGLCVADLLLLYPVVS